MCLLWHLPGAEVSSTFMVLKIALFRLILRFWGYFLSGEWLKSAKKETSRNMHCSPTLTLIFLSIKYFIKSSLSYIIH